MRHTTTSTLTSTCDRCHTESAFRTRWVRWVGDPVARQCGSGPRHGTFRVTASCGNRGKQYR